MTATWITILTAVGITSLGEWLRRGNDLIGQNGRNLPGMSVERFSRT